MFMRLEIFGKIQLFSELTIKSEKEIINNHRKTVFVLYFFVFVMREMI
jgi:hypothetical protein